MSLEVSASTNFYGRVIGFKEPSQTRGRDWAMNLIVLDDSFEGRADLSSPNPSGLSVMIFRPNAEDFPAVQQIGDIVQFRHFRTQYYESTIQALSTKWSAFTVFRKDPSTQHWRCYPDRPIYPEEQEVIERIHAMKLGAEAVKVEPSEDGPSAAVAKACALRPSLTVSEIRNGIFFNGTFKVMKISEKHGDSNQFSMLVCDFTENPFLTADATAIGLPAYLNQSLLPVTLWDNFADEARRINLIAGDSVYFDNLLGRQVRHTDGSSKIVAVLHGDPKAKNVENFLRIQKDPKKIALIESQAVRLEQLKQSLASEDLILKAAAAATALTPKKPSDQVIRVKKQQTKRTFAIKEDEVEPVKVEREMENVSPIPEGHLVALPPSPEKNTTEKKFGTEILGGDSFAVTTILSVRSYPADNAKFCIKPRLRTFSPHNFYETIRFICGHCDKSIVISEFFANDYTCSNCNVQSRNSDNKYVWVFCLVLEDATGDLPLIVAEEDAEYFLGMPAFNPFDPENQSRLNQVMKMFESLALNASDSEQLFCIKSYRVTHNNDGSSSLRYRLFNTKLV